MLVYMLETVAVMFHSCA